MTSNTTTITGVVLTLNEEANLGKALQSLTWCDDILVLDSGSTDNTAAIAASYGARFIQHIQPPPFLITEQRNWAIDKCDITSDWILFLDADEVVGSILRIQILKAINQKPIYQAYELAPRYWFLGKWLKRTQAYPNWHPRLVKRGCVYFEGGVWESFSTSKLVGRISEPYEHYAFSSGLDNWLERHMRYSGWEASKRCNLPSSQTQRSTTIRKQKRKLIHASLWPFRPLIRFFEKYVINFGFLDGWQGLLYSLLISFYELMVVIKIIQIKRLQRGLGL